ncbi:uncharacterized protein LOC116259435 isoform X2 [Nymphaea colorata]|uniref:uncharacterized protein LOC116259435 isoform X2 n=1 Tax=Nymphaea colorata TaxID=210225 RepID=UPI00129EAB0A|nr:uncharacterized protein LOC116259435 isoform X2 [Nymphaea colorata]
MEEEKAAAYFDDLTRRGEGAARFKQGLGYSAGSSSSPSFVKASGSFSLSNFVSASTRETEADIEKECRIERIQDKLRRKDSASDKGRGFAERQRLSGSRDSDERNFGESRRQRRRSRSRSYSSGEESGRGRSGHRHRSGYRASEDRRTEREQSPDEARRRRRRTSRSRSYSPDRGSSRHRSDYRRTNGSSESYRRSRDDSAYRGRRRGSRSCSPREKKRSETRKVDGKADIDYSRLIEGYDKMAPAERVKAKMRLQLSQTVSKDSTKGMSKEWERFDFNKDAPLDDENLEAEEDDSGLLKDVGRNFRFAAVEANREADIQAAHDNAIFGVPTAASAPEGEVRGLNSSISEEDRDNSVSKDEDKSNLFSVVNEKVLALQGGSWRDRARKLQNR